jgi:hypothetical protein
VRGAGRGEAAAFAKASRVKRRPLRLLRKRQESSVDPLDPLDGQEQTRDENRNDSQSAHKENLSILRSLVNYSLDCPRPGWTGRSVNGATANAEGTAGRAWLQGKLLSLFLYLRLQGFEEISDVAVVAVENVSKNEAVRLHPGDDLCAAG